MKGKNFHYYFRKYWAWVVSLSVIVGIAAGYEPIKKIFQTSKQKHADENLIEGDFKPNKIPTNSDPEPSYSISETLPVFINEETIDDKVKIPAIKGIYLKDFNTEEHTFVMLGLTHSVKCKNSDFYKGINIFSPYFNGCVDNRLTLGIKDNRLYISVEFKDLKKEETIGSIEFNHWKLYKPNLFDFYNDDKTLEVIDKQHNVVVFIHFQEADFNGSDMGIVRISGYYISQSSILVLQNFGVREDICISKTDPYWKEKAQTEISEIQKVNNN